MRPIVSAIGSPTYNVSKFLVEKFKQLRLPFESRSITNSFEFINKIKDVKLSENEILVSFDVSSLFPSVPVPKTLEYLREVLEYNNFDQDTIKELITLTQLCMNQNVFQYKGEFFEQLEGTAMGNCLSPFLAELFMNYFEENAKQKFEYFPRIWYRYVDDVFAVFDMTFGTVEEFVKKLNSQFDSIKFTYEIQNNEQLPFLDVLVIKNSENTLEFDIYRKETNTMRYITNDSNHCYQHKMASFNFLVHRLVNFPLSHERFEKEKKTIKQVARVNGYDTDIVEKLVRKRKFKKTLLDSTTFQVERDRPKNVFLPFDPNYTKGLDKVFKNLGLRTVYQSGPKLKDLLGNTKDKADKLDCCGIYEISCSDCNKCYIGQTKRSIMIRFKEHMAHLRYGRIEKSSVAEHVFNKEHKIDLGNLKLVRSVVNFKKLDAYESLEIAKKGNNAMNKDGGPIASSILYALVS